VGAVVPVDPSTRGDGAALAADLLAHFESMWADQGAPIAAALAPGLSDAEIDGLMAPTGLTLPAEARALFRWHDGAIRRPGPDDDRRLWGFGQWEFFPLAELVDYRQGMWMDTQEELSDDADEASPWADDWFPVLRGSGWADLLIDCTDDHSVALVRGTAPFEPGRALMSSLPALLETWLEFFQDGRIRWDAASQSWISDLDFETYKAALGD
jgi:cell wall assembly regulator SMI1